MKLDASHHTEEFSLAYVNAVAAAAGFWMNIVRQDYGMDVVICSAGPRRCPSYPRLDVQLKGTSDYTIKDEHVVFPLPVDNYEDLRFDGPRSLPRILVVVLVPTSSDEWVNESEEELAMRRCGYWMDLAGLPPKPNTATVSVYLPYAQRFCTRELEALMSRIKDTGEI